MGNFNDPDQNKLNRRTVATIQEEVESRKTPFEKGKRVEKLGRKANRASSWLPRQLMPAGLPKVA